MSEMMRTYWTNFAKTGNPNGADLPNWPAYSAAAPEMLHIASGRTQAGPIVNEDALKVLDEYWLGPKKTYLCGDQITIADYFGAGLVSIGELIDIDFSAYPNIKRWLENMKKLKSWNQVNEVFNGFVAANKGKKFVHA